MNTADCLAKARACEKSAAAAPSGFLQNGYFKLATYWREAALTSESGPLDEQAPATPLSSL